MKKMLCFIIIAFSLFIMAGIALSESSMTSRGSGGLSYVNADGKSATVFTLNPTIGLGVINVGFDINIFMPAKNKPKKASVFALRYLEYDDGTNGLRYGILGGITLGYGLIMNNYSTDVNGSTIFDASQAGIRAYTNTFAPYGLTALITNTRVNGFRVTYQPADLQLLSKQIKFGVSYAIDYDGVKTNAGTIGKGQSGFAADAAWLILDDLATLFVESGQLVNFSNGTMTGLQGRIFNFLDYQIDYRMFGSHFIPGYFNTEYEIMPTDLNGINTGSITGYHGSLGFNLGSLAYFTAEYQNLIYENTKKEDPSLKAILKLNEIAGVSGEARYEQLQMSSFSQLGSGGANIVINTYVPLAMIGISVPGNTKVMWKRLYTPDAPNGKFIDSTEFGYSLPFNF